VIDVILQTGRRGGCISARGRRSIRFVDVKMTVFAMFVVVLRVGRSDIFT